MTKLVEAELPASYTTEPLYLPYMPTVEEFYKSGMKCAEVEDDLDPARLSSRLKRCIEKLKLYNEIRACTRTLAGEKHIYLVREGGRRVRNY